MKPDFPYFLHLNEPCDIQWKPKDKVIVIKTKSGKLFVIDYKKLEIFYSPEEKNP